MKIHTLKILPKYYKAVVEYKKRFEFRINDRDYKVGDALYLKEWNNEAKIYTGRHLMTQVLYLFDTGVADMVILSISEPEELEFVGEHNEDF